MPANNDGTSAKPPQSGVLDLEEQLKAFEERMAKKQDEEDAAEEKRKAEEREKLRAAYIRRRGLL